MNPPTVFLVDDDAAVRDGLSLLCETVGLPVQSYDSAESFLAAYDPGRPGCLVLDVRMGPMSGPELQAELKRRQSSLPIIFLTGHGDIPLTVRAMKAGAVNFLTKPVNGEELLASIESALEEVRRQERSRAESASAASLIAGLTDREREVMVLAAQGLGNKEIARRLGISHRTVEIHKGRIMRKTGADSVIGLAQLVVAGGLGNDGDD